MTLNRELTLALLSCLQQEATLLSDPEPACLSHHAPEDRIKLVLEPQPGIAPEALLQLLPSAEEPRSTEAFGIAWLQVELPLRALSELESLSGLARWRAPHWGQSKQSLEERVEELGAEAWHQLGLRGSGVEVGIIDVGFAGWEEGFGPQVESWEFLADPEESEHGSAAAEILLAVAPEVRLHLCSFETDVEWLSCLEGLVERGLPLVSSSIGFDNIAPQDGSSAWSQAVDQAREQDTLVVLAAGNEAERYARGALGPGEGAELLIGGEARVQLQTGRGLADTTLLLTESSAELEAFIEVDGEPICSGALEAERALSLECDAGQASWAELGLRQVSGESSGEVTIYSAYGVASSQQHPASSLSIPADAAGAITVGAMEETALASYSSQGPTLDGRIKPDLVARTDITTASTGVFSGSSASAPQAAGVLALLLSKRPRADPERLSELLMEQVVDEGEPGPDSLHGAGSLLLQQPPCGCGEGRRSSSLWLLGSLLLGYLVGKRGRLR